MYSTTLVPELSLPTESFAALLERARDEGAKVDQVVMIGGDSDRGSAGGSNAVIGYEDLGGGRYARLCRLSLRRRTPLY